MAALSTHGDALVVGGCFSSIRVKSGRPSKVLVAPIKEDILPLTLNEVALSIEKYLFITGPAFLPACTMTGQEILWNDTSWSDGTFDQDLGPLGLKDDDGEGCIRIDVRDICPNAPATLVLQALNEMWKRKQIVSYGPAERPGRGAVYEIYQILRDSYTSEAGGNSLQ
jgi:hypothetical protein